MQHLIAEELSLKPTTEFEGFAFHGAFTMSISVSGIASPSNIIFPLHSLRQKQVSCPGQDYGNHTRDRLQLLSQQNVC